MCGSLEIVRCPPALVDEALARVLSDLPPSERQALAAHAPKDALFVALRGGAVVDAAWGHPQPGNSAVLWPPLSPAGAGEAVAVQLLTAVANALDAVNIRMTQVLLPGRTAPVVTALEAAGFAHLVDLMYLSWEVAPTPPPETLEFEAFRETDGERLARVVEATYVDSRDCPGVNGMRPMSEVLAGYRGTGDYRPENWLYARSAGADVGIVLLADHGAAHYWELMYMGLIPSFRGRGWGIDIVRRAQQVTREAGAERLLLAVDATNSPALAMYRQAGFTLWDQRTVYARFGAAGRDDRLREKPSRA